MNWEAWLTLAVVAAAVILLAREIIPPSMAVFGASVTLLVAGILMLVLPGQGILTILAALALLDFPGKRKMEMRILHRPAILKSVNWLRKRAGREPLAF